MNNSDVYIIRVTIKDGFEEEIKKIAYMQAQREQPRKLISVIRIGLELVLFFELVN